MAFKAVFICAFALLFQSIAGKSCYRPLPQQNCGSSGSVTIIETEPVVTKTSYRPSAISINTPTSYSSNPNCVSIDISQSGGPLAITSIGPITPTGIALATELGLAGDLGISGAVPYLSAVAFEGQFATNGVVPVSYGCGDGCIAITEQIGGNGSGLSGVSGLVGYGPKVSCGCGC